MKKIITIALAACVAVSSLSAQSQKEAIKDQKQLSKYTEKQLNEKASKDARKMAKRYKKDGWIVAPGQLPLEKQLDRSYNMQYEVSPEAAFKWVWYDAQSPGENYDAAKFQAMELAKLGIAAQLQGELLAIVENTIGNEQLPKEQAASVAQTIAGSKDVIAAKLGRLIPIVECYRDVPRKGKEVRVMAFYNKDEALKAATETVREELEKKGEDLHTKLDKLLGL
jgi:hypothetical protein